MRLRKLAENVFSSWVNLAVTVITAFVVSPIVVRDLGRDLYGVWTLVTSITGYFTVLDFGVNTAIVRYISRSAAKSDNEFGRAVYSTSMAIFAVAGVVVMAVSLVFAYFFQDIFELYAFPRSYLYAVFVVSALDLALGLVCSVFFGVLAGLQEFKFLNGTSLAVNLVKSVLIVVLLGRGYSLLALAFLQVAASALRALLQFQLLRSKYQHLAFRVSAVSRDAAKAIYSYSIYSFIIAVALKLLFFTDSVVIGAVVGVSQVAFYAIPATLLDYLEKFVWSMVAVLVPQISANEGAGESSGNVRVYITGTSYTLLVSMPAIISLYFYGGDFIRLWMGAEFEGPSTAVLRLLLVGFGFAFSQLIAHGILKGISRHKVLSIILALEALANLGMSVALAKPYGIQGVAVGTLVPLVVASGAIIIYTCRVLDVGVWGYFARAYRGAVAGTVAAIAVGVFGHFAHATYLDVALGSLWLSSTFLLVAIPLSLEPEHRQLLMRAALRVKS